MANLAEDTIAFGNEIIRARERLPQVDIIPEAEQLALRLIQELEISSHRAEIATLEAARAHAAADSRERATSEDIMAVAPMALRQRRSDFMERYFETAREEDAEIEAASLKVKEGLH
jgi:magnesium chelatase subunit I